MSGRLLSSLIVFSLVAGMMAFIAWPRSYKAAPAESSATSSGEIQSKATVFDLSEPDGFTKVGIMAAYHTGSHSLWWRPVPFIAEPSMLESYFEPCKFAMAGERLLNFCVRGNEVVVSTTGDYSRSLDQGLADAQTRLQTSPGLLMSYHGPGDTGFNLQQKAGVDMNTAEGIPPTVVRSVRKTAAGWQLDVTCGCGNALITLNDNFDFVGFKRN
jgi:hypothetical protein